MGVDVDDGALFDVRGVHDELAVGRVAVGLGFDAHAVDFEQAGDDLDVADARDPAQHRRAGSQQ